MLTVTNGSLNMALQALTLVTVLIIGLLAIPERQLPDFHQIQPMMYTSAKYADQVIRVIL